MWEARQGQTLSCRRRGPVAAQRRPQRPGPSGDPGAPPNAAAASPSTEVEWQPNGQRGDMLPPGTTEQLCKTWEKTFWFQVIGLLGKHHVTRGNHKMFLLLLGLESEGWSLQISSPANESSKTKQHSPFPFKQTEACIFFLRIFCSGWGLEEEEESHALRAVYMLTVRFTDPP